jgi:hypothetical protein
VSDIIHFPHRQFPSVAAHPIYRLGFQSCLAHVCQVWNGMSKDEAERRAEQIVADVFRADDDDRAARRALCDAGYMPVSEYVGPEAS